jgi:purine-binding chemotaxis protein CheW
MSPSDGTNGKKLSNSAYTPSTQQLHLVTFRLDRQVYALPIEPIQQIIEMVTITPVPQVNHSVEGVINFRGKAIPVVNLRRHLGMPKIALKLHTPIILVTFGEHLVGIIVDEVMDVLNCAASDVVHPREILPEGLGETPLLKGLLRSNETVVLLLDVDHLFQAGQAQSLAAAMVALPTEALEAAIPATESTQPQPAAAKSKKKSKPKPTASPAAEAAPDEMLADQPEELAR